MKGYKLWEPENKKIMLSKHVTFDETSLLTSTVSQQVENEDQRCIATGGSRCYSTTSSWFGISKDFTGCDIG